MRGIGADGVENSGCGYSNLPPSNLLPALKSSRKAESMVNKWRPDGWKNPYHLLRNGFDLPAEEERHYTFEAGANALLRDLRIEGEAGHGRAEEWRKDRTRKTGVWVFIPDDEVQK
jgi:hypothetical protein